MLVAILMFFLETPQAALAVLVGGLVGYLSNVIYLSVALKPLDNMNPNKVISRFYKGEALKLLSLFALFLIALVVAKRISQVDYLIYLLAGLVISQLVQAIGPMLVKQDR